MTNAVHVILLDKEILNIIVSKKSPEWYMMKLDCIRIR